MKQPFYKQQDLMDCGPTCLKMICAFYGRNYSMQTLRGLCSVNRGGVSLLDISEAAEKLGLQTHGTKLTLAQLEEVELPCILHWQQYHFVVLYGIKNNEYIIADPGNGIHRVNQATLKNSWFAHSEEIMGVALLFSPAPGFYQYQDDDLTGKLSWSFIFKYFIKYRQLLVQLILGLTVGTLLSLVAPFLTQAIVDIGINTRNLNFVYLILIAQSMLFLGNASVDFIRSWILLQVSSRVNISILTDFLIKLMKLPLSFYETKTTGDILQRMTDQQKIESFLTSTTLNTIFSAINFVVFTFVLLVYNPLIFSVSLSGTILYASWLVLFLKRRRTLNYKQFDNASDNQTNIVELVNGMQEIKLNNCEHQKRWDWEELQARLFKNKVQALTLTQYQQGGSIFINQAKNIIITFLSIKAVIDGHLSIGGMMAIQYIVGQINSPVEQMLNFVQSYQDAKISLERLGEIHELQDEEPTQQYFIDELPLHKSITVNHVTFTYPGAGNEPVLRDINLQIPEGKMTAIVGGSGSGKTTLLKLLLRIHNPERGMIYVGPTKLEQISFKSWRSACGTVMQDGFIFSDTVERNIAVGDEFTDIVRLNSAITLANITDFIDGLPFGLRTKIGTSGNGLSQGQKQRLLIARAVYKNPEYIFFDEATNALDAKNERQILDNLRTFIKGKTVVVVAHRLSTVSNADNIIVLEKGQIVEQGTHQELIAVKGEYYGLIKNQLELGV